MGIPILVKQNPFIETGPWLHKESMIWAHFLSLARSKLRLCSANHRSGYWSNLPCDWPSTAWAYSEQEAENGPWCNCSPAPRQTGTTAHVVGTPLDYSWWWWRDGVMWYTGSERSLVDHQSKVVYTLLTASSGLIHRSQNTAKTKKNLTILMVNLVKKKMADPMDCFNPKHMSMG